MESRVARRYARALFNTARDKRRLAEVSADLAALIGQFEGDEAFRQMLLSPVGDHITKTRAVAGLLEKLSPTAADFLRLLIDKRREHILPLVGTQFEELKHEFERVAEATIESAVELDEGQRSAIVRELEGKSGLTLAPTFVVDSVLIGGVRVTMGEDQIDGSVKGRLGKMRKKLFRDLLRQT